MVLGLHAAMETQASMSATWVMWYIRISEDIFSLFGFQFRHSCLRLTRTVKNHSLHDIKVISSCMDKLFLNLKIPIHCVIAPQNSITTFHIPFLMLRDRLYIIYIRGGWGSFLTSPNIVRSLFLQPV